MRLKKRLSVQAPSEETFIRGCIIVGCSVRSSIHIKEAVNQVSSRQAAASWRDFFLKIAGSIDLARSYTKRGAEEDFLLERKEPKMVMDELNQMAAWPWYVDSALISRKKMMPLFLYMPGMNHFFSSVQRIWWSEKKAGLDMKEQKGPEKSKDR